MKVGLFALLFLLVADIEFIYIGEITKIDTKNGVITIKERVFRDRSGSRSGPPGLGPGFPPSPRRGRARREILTTILFSPQTVFKPMVVGELKVGDFLQVTGKPQKSDVAASQIERMRGK